jgi:ferredoxin
VAGQVDQSGSMLSDDVAEKGYALLCMAVPQTDVKIMTVSEVSLWRLQDCQKGLAAQAKSCCAEA